MVLVASTPMSLLRPPPHRFLKRPFGRVDRPKLKRKLLNRCAANGAPLGLRLHGESGMARG